MLVVCNGAAKSGSTWLYNIVQEMGEYDWPDQAYLSNANGKHPTIQEKLLTDFLNTSNYVDHNIISKNHYGQYHHRELLLSNANVRVLCMSRDPRDVVVSSYYDSCRRDGFSGSFSDYYWQIGRYFVEKLTLYHTVWNVPHPQIFITTFEALKSDFETEASNLAAFLNTDMDLGTIKEIEVKTSLDSLRESYKDSPQYNDDKNPFFRKGEIGDWKNHFDQAITKDFNITERKGISRLDQKHLRQKLSKKIKAYFSKA